jgi:hypothetical protein
MTFKAKVTPYLHSAAQRLVQIYDQTPGSVGPYCNPDGLANVLDALACDGLRLSEAAAMLRGGKS